LKNQAIRDAKSFYAKYRKSGKKSVAKRPVAIWNNQNHKIEGCTISFPVFIEGKIKRLSVKIILSEYQKKLLEHKLGTLRITEKSGKLFAQISIEKENKPKRAGGNVLACDFGIRVPMTAKVSTGKAYFIGNGRQNKFYDRKFQAQKKVLGKAKKIKVIKKINNKEQRYRRDQDHKISRKIIDLAIKNDVSVIKLEDLSGIRDTARTSRKNGKELHRWPRHRQMKYIEYKAAEEGIEVVFVDPRYTSQKCPACKKKNKSTGRKYECSCGFVGHRDIVGATNILSAPVIDGVAFNKKKSKRTPRQESKSLSAHAAICTGMGWGDGTPLKATPSNLRELRITEMDLPTTT